MEPSKRPRKVSKAFSLGSRSISERAYIQVNDCILTLQDAASLYPKGAVIKILEHVLDACLVSARLHQ